MVGCWKDERMRVGKRLKLTLEDFWTTRCRLPWCGTIPFDKNLWIKRVFHVFLELYWRMLLEQASVNTYVCYICGDFHSWVEIRHAALMMTSLPKCQNVRISYRQKPLCVKRTWQKNTLPRYQNYESRGIHDIIFENGRNILPKKGILITCIVPTLPRSLGLTSWKPHTTTLASGRSVTTRRSMLVQKAVNGNQPWSYCRWHLRERGVGWVWRVGLLGCKKVGIGNLGNFGTFFIYRVHRSI